MDGDWSVANGRDGSRVEVGMDVMMKPEVMMMAVVAGAENVTNLMTVITEMAKVVREAARGQLQCVRGPTTTLSRDVGDSTSNS